jgi:uncharacterized protein (TIGR00730 family)
MDKMDKQIRKTSTEGLTVHEIKNVCRGLAPKDREEQLLCIVEEELKQGFEFIKKYPRALTILGSARTKESDLFYQKARELASRVVTDLGLTIISGGGPGIMEAANRGAKEAGGDSLGISISLPNEQSVNSYVTDSMDFHFFFTRKVIMAYSAKAYVFFPGGFGTLDEFFEYITLIQTKKVPPAPVFVFGTEYWGPLNEYIQNYLREHDMIDDWDEHLYVVTDSIDDIISNIKHFRD